MQRSAPWAARVGRVYNREHGGSADTMSDRSHPTVRRSALLLSALVLSPDSDLEGYRDHRAADPNLPLEHLTQARSILDAIAQAIRSDDAGRWARLAQVAETLGADAELDLTEPEPPPEATPVDVPAPSPAPPAVSPARTVRGSHHAPSFRVCRG